jgi:branched-chain amino acid aminotransferase
LSKLISCFIVDEDVQRFAIPQRSETFEDLAPTLPAGVYSTFRTLNLKYAIHLDWQFDRLEESAQLKGYHFPIHRHAIREGLRFCLTDRDIRLRLWMDLTDKPGWIYIISEELEIPSAKEYQYGVNVACVCAERTDPKAKQTSFLREAKALRTESGEFFHEYLLTAADHTILEGLSSNFFGVHDGMLWTEDERVLDGLTRRDVIAVAKSLNIKIQNVGIKRAEISQLDECFITSASRGILPVVRIDDHIIGNGSVGLMTKTLMVSYAEYIDRIKEAI